MLPLETVGDDNCIREPEVLARQLKALKEAGCEGVMLDVWWGLVEGARPKQYDFSAYLAIIEMVAHAGLKLQVVASFHKCGGNVGDAVSIPLPQWVLDVGKQDPDIFYTDAAGEHTDEYISCGADDLAVFPPNNRTPVQMYEDFIRAFCELFKPYFATVLTQIQVSLGPAGELRYPSYPLTRGWEFPGIGQLQCFDKYLRASLHKAAEEAGMPEWAEVPESLGLGRYNDRPYTTPFWRDGGTWETNHGDFLLRWYSQNLLKHADVVLGAVQRVIDRTCGSSRRGLSLAAKVAGIHWWHKTRSHAAECAAGYYNNATRDGYKPLAELFAKHHVHLDFTCLEMRNCETNPEWCCAPETLVQQVGHAAQLVGCEFAGENALARFDDYAYRQIVYQCYRTSALALTYLRVCPDMFQAHNLSRFARFCRVCKFANPDVMELLLLEWFPHDWRAKMEPLVDETPLTARKLCDCHLCLQARKARPDAPGNRGTQNGS